MLKTIGLAVLFMFSCSTIAADGTGEAPKQVLFKNVNIFDGKDETLKMGHDVLVENNLIKQIGKGLDAGEGATIIDGTGKTLMPGLIDMHTHLMLRYGVNVMRSEFDAQAVGAAAMESLQLYMQMGYTTVRDVGGNTLGIARNIAAGRLKGPRVYSSGGAISAISGHMDLAMFSENAFGVELYACHRWRCGVQFRSAGSNHDERR